MRPLLACLLVAARLTFLAIPLARGTATYIGLLRDEKGLLVTARSETEYGGGSPANSWTSSADTL
jgi:hypothetical protein